MAGCPGGGGHHWIVDDRPSERMYGAACKKCAQRRQFPAIQDGEEPVPAKRVRMNEGSKEHGYMFRDPRLMEQKTREYARRKPELIGLYLEYGSHFKAARAADPPVPVTSMRTLIYRWKTDGSIEDRRRQLQRKQVSAREPASITGEVVNVAQGKSLLVVTLKVPVALTALLRPGRVKIEYLSGKR